MLPPHRGGFILGLGAGSLGVWLLSTVGAVASCGCCGVGIISLGLAIPAWALANADLRLMAAGQMAPSGRGQTQAGKVCAIVSVALHVVSLPIGLAVVLIFGALVFGAAAGAAGGAGGAGAPGTGP
jgi:hypothetical protein